MAIFGRGFPSKGVWIGKNNVSSSSATGSLDATEGADTSSLTGSVLVQGSIAVTEGSDIADLTGLVVVTASLDATEGSDTGSFAGQVIVSGTIAAVEGADEANATGVVVVQGTEGSIEGADVAAIAGNVIVQGSLSETEGADDASISGVVIVQASIDVEEGADSASLTGDVTGDVTVVPGTGYVNETVTYTPRHERIGRPRPVEPPPQHHVISIKSGQGGQSVTAVGEFHIKGSSQESSGSAEFYIEAEIVVHQPQSARIENKMRMTGSARSSQVAAGVVAKGDVELVAVVKTGGEPLIVPSYIGEETPDPFFEMADRAA